MLWSSWLDTAIPECSSTKVPLRSQYWICGTRKGSGSTMKWHFFLQWDYFSMCESAGVFYILEGHVAEDTDDPFSSVELTIKL